MPRVYLPLLPLPALAILVAFSACAKPRSEEVSHVIPPPTFAALAAEPKPSAPAAAPAPAEAAKEEAPSADEVRAFEKKVRK
jgi:hypothetical protein